jgi:hypothetical protein
MGRPHCSVPALAAMTVRSKRIMWCMAPLGALVIGGVMLIPRSVSETSRLPRQEVVEIRKTIRREMWRKVVPSRWSPAVLQRLPGELWRTSRSKISPPSLWELRNDAEGRGYLVLSVEVVDRQGNTFDLFTLRKKGSRWVVIASM